MAEQTPSKKLRRGARAAEAPADARAAVDRLTSENSRLRASLDTMRERVGALEKHSDRDPLTALPGRQRFLQELDRVVSRVTRHATPAALLYIDLNGLRAINDQHGRRAGDAALVHVAKLLTQLIRTTDFLGRLRGDEFGLILDHLDQNSAIDTADRLERCIAANPLAMAETSISLSIAIGVATILPGDQAKEVVRRAEHNVHRAKEDA